MQTVDAIVMGLGPGGETVAGNLAEAGLDVVGIESELVGGECPYWGCVPSKMMIRAANLLAEARRIPGMAGDVKVVASYAPVAARIRAEATDNWNDQVAVDRFTSKGGTFVRGAAKLIDKDTVAVAERVLKARTAIVVATGTHALIPPIPGLAGTPFWTNREAISAETPPESLIVIGGGAIGSELAQVFARFGSSVTVVEAAPTLVTQEEPAAGELLAQVFETEGIAVHTGTAVRHVSHDGTQFSVTTDAQTFTATNLLIATGRGANLTAAGLEAIGVESGQRWAPVDEHLRITDSVWAVGDITGKGAFTHVATYQAAIATASILGEAGPGADYSALPRVTFTDPEIGSVGLTQKQALEQGRSIRVGTAQVPSTARGWLHKAGNEGFITIIEDVNAGALVGATSVGPAGGEVLGMLALAVHAKVPVSQLKSMIYAYPTFHRGIEDAIGNLAG